MPMVPVAFSQSAAHGAQTASANAEVTRQGRAEQRRRARAAAHLVRTSFPQVEQLRIELSFADASSISPAGQVHVLYPPAPAFFIYPCPHSDCDGEFDLDDAVRKAMSASTHAAQGSLLCVGARTGERGSKRPCELQLAYVVTTRYHTGS